MSIEMVKENEHSAAFELVLEAPKLDKHTVCEKLKKPSISPRSPLAERLDNAQKRRNEKLNLKKEKAAVGQRFQNTQSPVCDPPPMAVRCLDKMF